MVVETPISESLRASAGVAPLTARWTPMRSHAVQRRLWNSRARFRVVPAGRRSGKTELAKRYIVLQAITFSAFDDGWFVCAAPTNQQAKDIFWADLKRLVPDWALLYPGDRDKSINESELTIRLYNGAAIGVRGMDKPSRIEGRPLDGIVLDEYGNMKESAWSSHVRPALSTTGREGWAWLIGVPEGRNHYYKMAVRAQADETGEWEYFHWFSADILSKKEVQAAKRDMDLLTYQQEYEGSFLNFAGRAYYDFDRTTHSDRTLDYDPKADLILCFDFNRSPGVCVVIQEQDYAGNRDDVLPEVTGVIGEVYIPKNSNTPKVCRKIVQDWGGHQGNVYCYGDATGGARTTSSVDGSDWDLIESELRPVFKDRLWYRYPNANPRERVRVNSMNSRIKSADDKIGFLVDPVAAPNVIDDFEGVVLVEGGAGEIDKDETPELTHLSDAVGYYVADRHSITGASFVAE